MLVRPAELISPDFLNLIQRRKAWDYWDKQCVCLSVCVYVCQAIDTTQRWSFSAFICRSQLMRVLHLSFSALNGKCEDWLVAVRKLVTPHPPLGVKRSLIVRDPAGMRYSFKKLWHCDLLSPSLFLCAFGLYLICHLFPSSQYNNVPFCNVLSYVIIGTSFNSSSWLKPILMKQNWIWL